MISIERKVYLCSTFHLAALVQPAVLCYFHLSAASLVDQATGLFL